MTKPTREYIYGINPAFEVVRSGRRRIFNACINQSTSNNQRLRKLLSLLEKQEVPIEPVNKDRLAQLSKSKEHQGVVLKCSSYPYVGFEELLDDDKLLLLDNVEDPHNVGAILRSAEVLGFRSVLLSNKGVPDIYPSVVKVSAGATEFLRISKEMPANKYVRNAIEKGYQVVVLDTKGKIEIEDLKTVDIEKLLLVIGGEDKSVGQFILNAAHRVVKIGQHGKINSLNASVAAGIAMFNLSDRPKHNQPGSP